MPNLAQNNTRNGINLPYQKISSIFRWDTVGLDVNIAWSTKYRAIGGIIPRNTVGQGKTRAVRTFTALTPIKHGWPRMDQGWSRDRKNSLLCGWSTSCNVVAACIDDVTTSISRTSRRWSTVGHGCIAVDQGCNHAKKIIIVGSLKIHNWPRMQSRWKNPHRVIT